MSIRAEFHLQRGRFALEVKLDLPARGVTALFGPSGCGKTTLLRCIAGLEFDPQGQLSINSDVWQQGKQFRPVHQRELGYVFQEASLFPHLNVRKNLEYGYRRVAVKARQIELVEVIRMLGLEELLQKFPEQLSGGQRQRVALGRALLTSPKLLLMDEPLAALDQQSKAEIIPYLETVFQSLSIPVIYVSHAIEEVAQLAQHMVLLVDGKTLASGDIHSMLTRDDLPIAHAENAAAIIDAQVLKFDPAYNMLSVAFESFQLLVPFREPPMAQQVRIRVAARDVLISKNQQQAAATLNSFPARVERVSADAHPAHVLVQVRIGETCLLSRITRILADRLALAPGDQVQVQFKAVALS